MTKAEALKKALDEIKALSPEELAAELEKYKDAPIAVALREASEFLYPQTKH